MKYRRLGKTDLKVSVIGFGAWQLGGSWGKQFEQSEVDGMLQAARALGINLIDTAECYGDHLSETLVGNAVHKERDKWIIATKYGHNPNGPHNPNAHWTATEVKKQLEASLKALRTDYVDLYQFHSGNDEAFNNDELWGMLEKQVAAGKVRHLGISIGSNDNLYQTDASTRIDCGAIQVVYNRLNRKPEERVLASCIKQDLGVLARVPLASGYLSGKYRPGARWPEGDIRHQRDPEQSDNILRKVDEIKKSEVPEGVNMASWALAWCLKHPAVTCVIPGCKDIEQVKINAAAQVLVEDGHSQDWKDGPLSLIGQ